MKPQPEAANQEVLAGLIERVTYHNAENGFCVLRAKARGHRDVVTVVGHAATIAAGGAIAAMSYPAQSKQITAAILLYLIVAARRRAPAGIGLVSRGSSDVFTYLLTAILPQDLDPRRSILS